MRIIIPRIQYDALAAEYKAKLTGTLEPFGFVVSIEAKHGAATYTKIHQLDIKIDNLFDDLISLIATHQRGIPQ
jgi:hypothetical protein